MCPCRRNRGSVGGFTLMELLVVVILLSIAAAVVVPRALDTADIQALAAARTTASDLEYARDLAITTTNRVKATFTPAAASYTLTQWNEATSSWDPIAQPITKATSYKVTFSTQYGFGRVNLSNASFGGQAYVTFDETGTPVDNNGVPLANDGAVTISAGSTTYTLTVQAATGIVTVN